MNQSLVEALQWGYCQLFTQKACHVFAEALLDRVESDGWIFFRVGRRDPQDQFSQLDPQTLALHVCVGKNGCYVDVCGRHTEEELLCTWRSKAGPRDVEHIQGVFPCTKEELFAPIPDPAISPLAQTESELDKVLAQHRATNPPGSKFGLAIDEEFRRKARGRAEDVIVSDPSKYRLT